MAKTQEQFEHVQKNSREYRSQRPTSKTRTPWNSGLNPITMMRPEPQLYSNIKSSMLEYSTPAARINGSVVIL